MTSFAAPVRCGVPSKAAVGAVRRDLREVVNWLIVTKLAAPADNFPLVIGCIASAGRGRPLLPRSARRRTRLVPRRAGEAVGVALLRAGLRLVAVGRALLIRYLAR
jgi:hypothetical protein